MNENNLDILNLLGINAKDGKIDIDLNKTKSFFTTLQETLQEKAQKIDENIKNDKVDLEDVGLKIDKEHISLDLNKTKNFFDGLTQKLEKFVEEIDKTAKELKRPLDNGSSKGNE